MQSDDILLAAKFDKFMHNYPLKSKSHPIGR